MIHPCTYDEDIKKIKEVDWVIEVVTEDLNIKNKVYLRNNQDNPVTILVEIYKKIPGPDYIGDILINENYIKIFRNRRYGIFSERII